MRQLTDIDLIQKILTEIFNIKKSNIQILINEDTLKIEYIGSVAAYIVRGAINDIHNRVFNSVTKQYEYKPLHKKGLVYDGQELPTFNNISVSRKFTDDFSHKLLSYVWQNYSEVEMGANVPTLSAMRKTDRRFKMDWEGYVINRILVHPHFATQDLEKINFVDYRFDDNSSHYYISYTIDSIDGIFYTNKPVYNVEARKNLKPRPIKLPFHLMTDNDKACVRGYIPHCFLQTLKEMGGQHTHNGIDDIIYFHSSMQDTLSNLILDYIAQ